MFIHCKPPTAYIYNDTYIYVHAYIHIHADIHTCTRLCVIVRACVKTPSRACLTTYSMGYWVHARPSSEQMYRCG